MCKRVDLSIAIVSWNTKELLLECLSSIYNTTNIDFEIIVVDNASSDGTVEVVRSTYPTVLLIENKDNVGFATANNQAYTLAAGRYFMLLNPDTVVHGGLADGIKYMDIHPDIAVLGCKSFNPDGSIQISWNKYFPNFIFEILPTYFKDTLRTHNANFDANGTFPSAWVGGVCMVIRRFAAQEVGLLDDGYFMYSEETDWCKRFWMAGWKVYHAPYIEITHYGGQSSKQAPLRTRIELARSKVRFISKYRSKREAHIYVLFLLLSVSVKYYIAKIVAFLSRNRNRCASTCEYLSTLKREYRNLGSAYYCGE